MGVMRFLIHPGGLLDDWPEVYRAYITGLDQSAWPTRVEFDGELLICRRQSSESGKLHVAWPVEGFGKPVLRTASLPEREQPFVLPVELARGKIVQVRDQLATWEMAGLTVPDEFHACHTAARRSFAKAVSRQNDTPQASALAQQAITNACKAAELLTIAFSEQNLLEQHEHYQRLPTSLGCSLGNAQPDQLPREEFCQAFNSATISVGWRDIEPKESEYHWDLFDRQVDWCATNRLVTRGGPLLDLSPDGLPQWLWQWENDYWNLQSFVCDFVETAVRRYQGRIRLWELAARVNSGGALVLSEEHRLTLVAKALEVARHVDEEAELMVRIDQPWGEYQARGQHKLSPLHFADALVRAGLGLSAINLEIAIGFRPRGTAPRDLMELSALIDRWSILGIPLHVTLAFPSSREPDPQTTSDLEVDKECWKLPWSEQAQAQWVDECLPLLIAKPAVVAIDWAHCSDAFPHSFPNAGLLRPDGSAKPVLAKIIEHRSKHLR